MPRIILCFPVEPQHVEQIASAIDDAEVVNAGQAGVASALHDADIFIGHAKVPVDWNSVVSRGRLRWIQSSAAGLDHCLVPPVINDPGIIVSSASGLFAPQVAEQTFTLLFNLIRRGPLFESVRAKREFVRRPTDDLRGKTVGIVGFGGNGRAIARTLSPWEVTLLASDVYPVNCPSYVKQLYPAEKTVEMVGVCDVLILTVPLNRQTHGWFDKEMFSRMKRGSYLINVARGAVVVEADLVDALESGRLAGAGLDVTEVEPLPEESRLWDNLNVVLSPHIGAQSARRVSDTVDLACLNLRRFVKGEKPFNLVDKRMGFPHPDDAFHSHVAAE